MSSRKTPGFTLVATISLALKREAAPELHDATARA